MSQSHSNWTNREQKEILIKLMEENPEVAKGFSTNRVDTDRFWRDAAEKINSYGPPSKDGASWKKVWADFKSKTKKKLVENEVKRKQSGFNDNNLKELCEFEEAIVRITSINQSVAGISAKVFGITQVEEPETVSRSKDVSMISCPDENLEPDAINEGHEEQSMPSRNRGKKDSPVQMLQKQNEVQEVFFAELTSKLNFIKEELHRMNRYLQKSDDIQKKMYDENRRHNLAVENIMREKLELKKKVLEVQLDQVMAKLAAT